VARVTSLPGARPYAAAHADDCYSGRPLLATLTGLIRCPMHRSNTASMKLHQVNTDAASIQNLHKQTQDTNPALDHFAPRP
jgi:hypothetical protein